VKNKYLDRLTTLLEQTDSKLTATYRLEFKNVFGAVAGYINGNIFISCGKFGIALKLPPPEFLAELFKEKGIKHLQYFPNGHVKKEYAVIPQRIIENKQRFKKILYKSIHDCLNNRVLW